MSFEEQCFDFLKASATGEHHSTSMIQAPTDATIPSLHVHDEPTYNLLDDIYDDPSPSSALDNLVANTYSTFGIDDFENTLPPPQPPAFQFSSSPMPPAASLSSYTPALPRTITTTPISNSFTDSALISPLSTTPPISTPPTHLPSTTSSSPPDRYKCHCGFTPSGEERWKASNLRRHKRTQHPPDSGKKIWKCQFPGCSSEFTRSDNLRSHQKSRGHIGVGDVNVSAGFGMGMDVRMDVGGRVERIGEKRMGFGDEKKGEGSRKRVKVKS
jgi:hypothetical protein